MPGVWSGGLRPALPCAARAVALRLRFRLPHGRAWCRWCADVTGGSCPRKVPLGRRQWPCGSSSPGARRPPSRGRRSGAGEGGARSRARPRWSRCGRGAPFPGKRGRPGRYAAGIMAGASALSPLVCAFQRGARAWRMGHRPPLCRRHFNRPHLQYSTCCRQRGSPGAHTPPEETGWWPRRRLTRAKLWRHLPCRGVGSASPAGQRSTTRAGVPSLEHPARWERKESPRVHPWRLWQGTQGPGEAPGRCSAKQHWLDIARVLVSHGRNLVSYRGVKAQRPWAQIIPPSMGATPVLKHRGFLLHEPGRVGCWLLLPSLPQKLSHLGSH